MKRSIINQIVALVFFVGQVVHAGAAPSNNQRVLEGLKSASTTQQLLETTGLNADEIVESLIELKVISANDIEAIKKHPEKLAQLNIEIPQGNATYLYQVWIVQSIVVGAVAIALIGSL